jgi:FkbM family methyltransferase
LEIIPEETIGRQIYHMGVFDLSVSETLWRLTDSGTTAFDIGGNIGYTCSILARAAGPTGRVHAFEPHPEVVVNLRNNVALWPAPPHAAVTVHEMALGRSTGTIKLCMPDGFGDNHGLASIHESVGGTRTVPVTLQTVDAMQSRVGAPSIIKIDVEGAEEDVLEGSHALLSSGRTRDVVFEDSGDMPTPPCNILTRYGYKVFALRVSGDGPVVTPVGEATLPLRSWDTPSYLATLDVKRMQERFAAPGWRCLSAKPGAGC